MNLKSAGLEREHTLAWIQESACRRVETSVVGHHTSPATEEEEPQPSPLERSFFTEGWPGAAGASR
jgi:hypothetical protein